MTEEQSLMEWLRCRVDKCTSHFDIIIYQKVFLKMWKEEFGTTDSIPSDFKNEIGNKYYLLKNMSMETRE